MEKNTGKELKGLLRFTTAGSVDDGKSTLIGRLLYDSKSIFEDQMDHLVQSSKRLGKENIDLSLLTDGLRDEREQGITIDVAYRYFATPHRKFIIADTPGHVQYTRNMVTGASTADLAIILIDARKGVLEQTLRHSYIASLLDIRYLVFCINKMDMADYSQEVFESIKEQLQSMIRMFDTEETYFLPISAKLGDNVVNASSNMTWYNGPTLLSLLESIDIKKTKDSSPARFPVQTVIRPQSAEYHDYRGYAGRIAGASFRVGDEVLIYPSGLKSRIASIDVMEKTLKEASDGESVSITLSDQLDIGRGNLFVKASEPPRQEQEITLMLCWFSETPLKTGIRYLVRNFSNEVPCFIKSVNYKMNINKLEKESMDLPVTMNDIANITIKTVKPLYFDSYKQNNITGSLILIEEGTNNTVAAGMIE
ncbi:MAG: GTP-binding protein [Bacteroidales bacterium]|jgi:sulfate adenylyltransferase subunit 1|nr:GTP-binding protein [Bacteroidales bacterium]